MVKVQGPENNPMQSVEVWSAEGKLQLSRPFLHSSFCELDLVGMDAGIYFVKAILDDGRSVTSRLVRY
jgi:hypothetical protein